MSTTPVGDSADSPVSEPEDPRHPVSPPEAVAAAPGDLVRAIGLPEQPVGTVA